MAAPVWVLSVDLQAKTATFTSGLADAAKQARGSFNEMSGASRDMAEGFERSSLNVRSAIGLVDNTIRGNHAAAMADLVREFSHTSIVMNALPFAAVVGGIAAVAGIAVEVASKIREWREEQQRLEQEQMKFGTTVTQTYNGLDEKIIAAEQKTDELRNDHIGALGKQLELINRQSFAELIHNLETVAKAADTVFGELKGNWYTFGIGSDGAKHALDQFQAKYTSLISQGKAGEAADLLKGTRDSAQKILDAQNAYNSSRVGGGLMGPSVDYTKQYQALAVLKAAGVGTTQKEVEAQQTLVSTLNAQLGIEQRVNELKGLDSGNAKRNNAGEMSRQSAEAAKQSAESQVRMGEMVITADRAKADAQLQIQHASIADKLASDVEFANRERDVQLAGNTAQLAALDRFSKDYANQKKALLDKAVEIQQQHDTKVAQLTAQSGIQQAALDLRNLQESEREKVAATDQGSAERLAAIDAAIKEEQSHNLQAEDSYRALLQQRVETVRQKAAEEAQQKAEAGRIAADNDMRISVIRFAAMQEQQALADSARRMTDERKAEEEIQAANEQYAIQMTAFSQQIAALDKYGKDYDNKLRALQNRQKQLTQQHENEVTAIQDKATEARNQRLLAGENQMIDLFSRGMSSVLVGQQTFASMMNSIGSQITSGMLQNAIQDIATLDMTREHEAAAAARKMFLAGAKLPFPANIVAAPVMGAAAFASVMAYADGGIVPGVGRGDVVPAMLTPGEGVVPGGVMDGLSKMARSGSMGGESTTHIHLSYRPQIHAIDGPSVSKMLKTHGKEFAREFHGQVRRMNK
jgi:uncharacterized protein YdcH (DUF465 family)